MSEPSDVYARLRGLLAHGDLEGFRQSYLAVTKSLVIKDPVAAAEFVHVLVTYRRLEEGAGVAMVLSDLFPEHHLPLSLLGYLHRLAGDYRGASRFYDSLRSQHAKEYSAIDAQGHAFCESRLRNPLKAIELYKYALVSGAPEPEVLSKLHHQQQLICDWNGVSETWSRIKELTTQGLAAADPFAAQAACSCPKKLLTISELAAKSFGLSTKTSLIKKTLNRSKKQNLKLGFVSGEFRAQATSFLLVGVLEELQKRGVELIFFDNGFSDASSVRGRLERCGKFVPIARMSDKAAVKEIQSHQLAIAFNLNGYFGKHRTPLFKDRLANNHVNYLGFPGTLGSTDFDFIVCDDVVIKEGEDECYSEAPLRMKRSYQPNDGLTNDDICAAREKSRLHRTNINFGCFNNSYKLSYSVLDTWGRILNSLPRSKMILLEENRSSSEAVRNALEGMGVGAERVYFLPRVSRQEHLARHADIDLFLDTWPMGAHTTASDALRRGVPVLTYPGRTFSSRVAASILTCLELDWFVAATEEEYIQKAVSFGHSKELRDEMSGLTLNQVLSGPLFDPSGYADELLEKLKAVSP